MQTLISIGCDIEEISRFKTKSLEKDFEFLNRVYTKKELKYSFKSRNHAQHLCARYCAKEAVVKALSDFKINDVYYSDIEILNENNGMPYVELNKYPNLKVKISLSHCKTYAVATALIIKEPE